MSVDLRVSRIHWHLVASPSFGGQIAGAGGTPHIVRKAGKKFKKSRKFNVLDLYEIDMGGPYAPSVPCTVHKNDFYSLVWL